MGPLAKEHSIAMHASLEESLPPIFLDPEGIQRCILNLVANAIDACVDAKSSSGKVFIRTLRVEGWGVEYQVQDNGCGMDDDIRAKLFNEFFSTKGTRGMGLGLMLTKKIVDAHRGEIFALSQQGKGALLIIRLPANIKKTGTGKITARDNGDRQV